MGLTASEQEIMKKLHDKSYEMLCRFDDICRKHGIKYCLVHGTLLGAVRHKDFIPWDDDIDIYISRENYNKLLEFRDEFKPYYIHEPNPEDRSFWDFTPRIVNEDVVLLKDSEETEFYNHINCQYLFIDLFVLDNHPEGFLGKLQVFEMKLLYVLATSKRYKGNYNQPKSKLAQIPVFVLSRLGYLFSLETLLKMYDRVSKKYNSRDCDEYIASTMTITYLSKNIHKKAWYKEIIELPIRERTFFASSHYDEILRHHFGNYMEFPPEEKRVPDHAATLNEVVFK